MSVEMRGLQQLNEEEQEDEHKVTASLLFVLHEPMLYRFRPYLVTYDELHQMTTLRVTCWLAHLIVSRWLALG